MKTKNLSFQHKMMLAFQAGKFVCVGLDPDPKKIPEHIKADSITETIFNFNKAIIDATADIVCAYKPNSAFYEAHGLAGIMALKQTVDYISAHYPSVVIILDAKRGDIGNTNDGYVKSAFDFNKVDAITINPYMGSEANQPFLSCADKGVFVLCKTSNPGSGEFQNLMVNSVTPLYVRVAEALATHWNGRENVCLVVGATYPSELAIIRAAAPRNIILIPGIGAQGGDLEAAVRAGKDMHGAGFVINLSRSVLYASNGEDFADAARIATEETHNAINIARALEPILPPTVEEITSRILEEAHAVLSGHFVYTSGDHGSAYINKDMIYVSPERIELLCYFLALHFSQYEDIDTVVGPATGGIIISQYVTKHLSLILGKPVAAVYAEKAPEGGFVIKRGYDVFVAGKNILLVEDILNSGGSAEKLARCVEGIGGSIVGLGALCNRGGVTKELLGVPVLYQLLSVSMEKYPATTCPLCANKVTVNTQVGKGKEFIEKLKETVG